MLKFSRHLRAIILPNGKRIELKKGQTIKDVLQQKTTAEDTHNTTLKK